MKIAILNAEAGGNKGAEAMLEILVEKLIENIPNCEIFLEVSNKIDYYNSTFLKRFKSSKLQLLPFKPKSIFNPYGNKTRDINLAIDIGGINFTGNSKKALFRNLVRFTPFLKNGKNLIFFTQDFGPSKSKLSTTIGSYVLKRASGIFTRSTVSHNEVINVFKANKNIVYGPFPDSTLLFHPKDVFKLGTNKKYIILCPSAIMYTKYGQDYIQLFKRFYDEYKDKYDIVILVHNFTLNFGNTDEKVCEMLKDECPDAILVNKNISTGSLKSILANSVFSISSRYHVVVGSISQNLPSIAIGWNPKYKSFLKLYNKESWNIEYNDNSFSEVLKTIENDEFLNSKSDLIFSNQELKNDVSRSFELLFNTINKIK